MALTRLCFVRRFRNRVSLPDQLPCKGIHRVNASPKRAAGIARIAAGQLLISRGADVEPSAIKRRRSRNLAVGWESTFVFQTSFPFSASTA